MALRIKTPKLKINFLVLVGTHKNYIVPFETGLNIIYGDSDTGKSSILNLINYCLGYSYLETYDEIEMHGLYCLLEVNLLGITYTIKRDIFNVKGEIEIYQTTYDNIENAFPKYYSPNFTYKSEHGYLSEFLMEAMNIPVIKIKESPSKEETRMVALSFRDIFKYNYLDQDKIGSKKIFGENYAVLTKLKETFKLMYNVLDGQITELEGRIADLKINKTSLETKNKSVSSFLNDTQVESLTEITLKKEELETEFAELKSLIENIDNEIINGSDELNYLRKGINNSEWKIRQLSQDADSHEQSIRQNIALRNEYTNDIKKMEATIEAIVKFPRIADKQVDCPVCDTPINVSKLKTQFIDSDSTSIKGELTALKRRMKDLDKIYRNLKEEQIEQESEIKKGTIELEEMRVLLDKQSVNIVSPYLSQRDALSYRAGTVQSDLKNLQHFYKIRLQQSLNDAEIVEIEHRIQELRDTLATLKENAPTLDGVFSTLGTNVREIISFIGIKNAVNISISPKTFLPIIRGRDYEAITSGGVRTVSSLAYFLSLMIYATENPVNYPSFLMVDTVAKYLGKTREKDLSETDRAEDLDEGMTDSKKYENIYNYILSLNSFKESFQLIVVDNDIPQSLISELQPHIRKHFSTNLAGTDIGFIDDAPVQIESKPLDYFAKEDETLGEIDFDDDDFPSF